MAFRGKTTIQMEHTNSTRPRDEAAITLTYNIIGVGTNKGLEEASATRNLAYMGAIEDYAIVTSKVANKEEVPESRQNGVIA